MAWTSFWKNEEATLDPIVVHREPLYLAGMSAPLPPRTTSPSERPRVIQELARAFRAKVGEISNRCGAERYSVIENDVWDTENPPVIRAMVAVTAFDGLPAWCQTFVVAPGRYAVFEHKGLPKDLSKTVADIYVKWVPRIDGLFKINTEIMVYPPEYNPADPNAVFGYWLPLAPP